MNAPDGRPLIIGLILNESVAGTTHGVVLVTCVQDRPQFPSDV
jgi:hypothetical protein